MSARKTGQIICQLHVSNSPRVFNFVCLAVLSTLGRYISHICIHLNGGFDYARKGKQASKEDDIVHEAQTQNFDTQNDHH